MSARSISCSATRRPVDQRTRTVAYEKAMEALAGEVPGRCRGADLLRAGARSDGAADRQDLREPAEGRRHSRSGVHAPTRASRSRALHHSQLRRAGARAARARRGAPLREDRARRGARAPHAVAHVHARGFVAGIDRHEPGVGRGRAQGRRHGGGAARARLSGVRLPADRAGRGRKADARRNRRSSPRRSRRRAPATPRRRRRATTRWRPSRRATRSSATRGPKRPRCTPHETPFAWADAVTHFAARARRRANRQRRAPRGADIDRLAALRDALAQGQRRVLDRAGRDSAARRDRVGDARRRHGPTRR